VGPRKLLMGLAGQPGSPDPITAAVPERRGKDEIGLFDLRRIDRLASQQGQRAFAGPTSTLCGVKY
jgi:hypothetical protein